MPFFPSISASPCIAHVEFLRGLAIILVVLFHLEISGFPGGFVGVDMFFVLSGFLMTKILTSKSRNNETFSFLQFQAERMRRILPLIPVMLFLCTLSACAFFPAYLLQQYGRALVSSTLPISNIYFWYSSGYFERLSQFQPLLHMWSLSVEVQFYFFFPFFFKSMSSFSFGWRVASLVAIVLSIAAANVVWIELKFEKRSSSTTFFWTCFRFHEFVIGHFSYLVYDQNIFSNKQKVYLVLAGFSFIFSASTKFHTSLQYPSWYALFPCLGTSMIILGGNTLYLQGLFYNRAVRYIGRVSYSWYLMHWPMFVFYKYLTFETLTLCEKQMLFFSSFALSAFMYHNVEKRFVNILNQPNSKYRNFLLTALLLCLLFFLLIGLGMSFHAWSKFPGKEYSENDVEAGQKRRRLLLPKSCTISRLLDSRDCNLSGKHQMLIFGNSHEIDGYNIFRELFKNISSVNIIRFEGTNMCEIYFDKQNRPTSKAHIFLCKERVEYLTNPGIVNKLNYIVFSFLKPFSKNHWAHWATIHWLMQNNPTIKLIVIGGYLVTDVPHIEVMNRYGASSLERWKTHVVYSPFNELEAMLQSPREAQELQYLYINKSFLCSNASVLSCATRAGKEPFSYDRHHLSFDFAKFVGREVKNIFADKFQEIGLPKTNS